MSLKITCFGEVLWDVFPTYKKEGGAPLNVAIRLASFGNDVSMISSIGNDVEGKELVNFIKNNDVKVNNIQIDSRLKTGEVSVMLNDKGSASYDILYPRSWDNISISKSNIEQVSASDAFIYGTLVARSETSKNTLHELLEVANFKILDVNLRPPHYSKEILLELMGKADFIKFNDEELFEISKFLGSKFNSLEQNISFISEKTSTKKICVTKGRHGAVLYCNDNLFYNSGYLINVIDTVGSGDSFLATLINSLLKREDPQLAIDKACAVGALVASENGANPKIDQTKIDLFMNP